MSDYKLAKNELEIMQEDSASLLEGDREYDLDELILTNQNLVLVLSKQVGFFKRETFFKRCPLAKLQGAASGKPHIFPDRDDGEWTLRLLFESEAIALQFANRPKRSCLIWAKAIERASVGDIQGAFAASNETPEIEALINGARSTIGSLFGGGSKNARPQPQTGRLGALTLVSTKCTGCRAPINGQRGTMAVCEYCGTSQVL